MEERDDQLWWDQPGRDLAMTQANDLSSRLNLVEDNIINLRLAASALLQAVDKTSADIADLIEVSRHLSAAT
ncbi:MAG: hypothetical protein NZ772_12320 [Cyanobacteria bacterium]|nr:hypothetical protein [Cyanobacteriota bacterium]MDW8202104.1 hypothetical protein [Cyanobacteriota bacterium SKYGB_h_bin112]